ncbi:MAG TPA: hypothetical protein VJH70_03080 [Candidatus Paceibacterota bacterium]
MHAVITLNPTIAFKKRKPNSDGDFDFKEDEKPIETEELESPDNDNEEDDEFGEKKLDKDWGDETDSY